MTTPRPPSREARTDTPGTCLHYEGVNCWVCEGATDERDELKRKVESLTKDLNEVKTAAKAHGGHYCQEWDGMYIVNGMKETEACWCFDARQQESEAKTDRTDEERYAWMVAPSGSYTGRLRVAKVAHEWWIADSHDVREAIDAAMDAEEPGT